MTNNLISGNEPKKIAVVFVAPNSSDALLASLKKLFSLKPASWKIKVHLLIQEPSTSIIELVDSLNLAIRIFGYKSPRKLRKTQHIAAQEVDSDVSATLLVDARTKVSADAYGKFDAFHRQYPNAVLIGQLAERDSSQISSGGYRAEGIFGKLQRFNTDALPLDADGFDVTLVLVPNSVSEKIGQPVGPKAGTQASRFVRRAKRAGIKCLVLPGNYAD